MPEIFTYARESAYLRQVNFYRRSLFEKFLRGHVRTVPGNTHVKFEVRSFNRLKLTVPLRTDTCTHQTKTVSPKCPSVISIYDRLPEMAVETGNT